ncbi:unnamed protein product, partial [Discosporangium mesarthrocarpum]
GGVYGALGVGTPGGVAACAADETDTVVFGSTGSSWAEGARSFQQWGKHKDTDCSPSGTPISPRGAREFAREGAEASITSGGGGGPHGSPKGWHTQGWGDGDEKKCS